MAIRILLCFLIAVFTGHLFVYFGTGMGWPDSCTIIEGVTKGDPLEMIACGIGILPLIKNLKIELPGVTQPWYADDAGTLGTFARTERIFIRTLWFL